MSDFPLGLSRGDRIKGWSKGIVGVIPYAGPILAELIEQTIPDFRMERLEKYVTALGEAIEERPDREEIKRLIKTESNADLFEEGARQSLRALSEEKRQYIAKAVVNGISENEIDQIEATRMLRLLSETDDAQIIVLYYYAIKMWGNWGEQQRFEKEYPSIFDHKSEKVRLLREEAEALLERSGFIKTYHQYGVRKRYSEVGLPGDEPKLEMQHNAETVITPLGGKLLEQIGILPKE